MSLNGTASQQKKLLVVDDEPDLRDLIATELRMLDYSVDEAENSERFIQGTTREWNKRLISKHNPAWNDLTDELAAL